MPRMKFPAEVASTSFGPFDADHAVAVNDDQVGECRRHGAVPIPDAPASGAFTAKAPAAADEGDAEVRTARRRGRAQESAGE